jgi:hypothetical protein
LILITPCHDVLAQSTDFEYVKKVNPTLYKELLRIEKCQLSQKSTEQCQQEGKQGKKIIQLNDEIKLSQINKQVSQIKEKAVTKPLNWWLSSAYHGNKTPGLHWNHALQGSLSLSDMNGNLKGNQYSANVNYYTRYKQWTQEILLGYSKDYAKQDGFVALDRQYRKFNYNVLYDVDEDWFGQVGYLIEEDTSLLLEDKNAYYIGVGTHLFSSNKLVLKALLAIGRQKELFSEQNQLATGLDEFNYNLGYSYEKLTWNISKNIIVNQSLELYYSMNKLADFELLNGTAGVNESCVETLTESASYCVSDYERRVIVKFSLGVEYRFNQYLSLALNLNFMNNSQPFLTDEPRSSTHNISVIGNFQ